ncbi:MAG: MurR/RpiR family transcriptional regulator [Acidobacteria bacterium]|nr:MurR/RpiR family transcriptional regulator [Acidobacteriota bacterium]
MHHMLHDASGLNAMQTNSQSPLEARILRAQGHLNERRRRLLRAIIETAEESCFLSSRELARRHGVDPSTVVRTIQALGYERFGGFAADLRGHFVRSLTPYSVLQAGASRDLDLRDRVRQSLHDDLERMRTLQSSASPEQVIALARLIHRARRIVVVGVDLAASLSWFLAYSLTALGFHAEAPTGSAGNLLHRVRFLTTRDLLIAISFRKCLKETVDAARLAHSHRVPTFGITDSGDGPLGRHCDQYLAVSIESPSITGSYVASMAALNAIVVACTHLSPKRSLAALRHTREEYGSGSRWFQEPSSDGTGHRARRR